MYEKLVTFEEEKRREHIYLLFNSLFVGACFIVIFEAIFSIPFLITDGISNLGVRWFVETLLRPICSSMPIFLPFFIYNVRQEKPLKEKLKPEKNKISALYYVLGIVIIAALIPLFYWAGESFSQYLISEGYVIHEKYPDMGQGTASNIFYVIYTSAISAIILEPALRGVICEKLSYSHTALALILPSIISSFYTYSFIRVPYLFVSSLVISWCYLKTKSLYLSIALNFASSVTFSVLLLLKDSIDLASVSVIGIVVAAVCFIVLAKEKGLKVKYPEPKNSEEEYERLTSKEAVKGLAKSFAFWIFLFICVFQIFFIYLDKPEPEPDGLTEAAVTIQENE